MNKALIKYVGLKEAGESAFHHLTGLNWFPGSVHEVDAAHASQMLAHPDVFARAEAGDAPAIGNTTPTSVSTGGDGTTGDTDPLGSDEFTGLGAIVGRRAVQETDTAGDDGAGISLTPGSTVAAAPAAGTAAPAPASAPAVKTTTAKTTAKAKAK